MADFKETRVDDTYAVFRAGNGNLKVRKVEAKGSWASKTNGEEREFHIVANPIGPRPWAEMENGFITILEIKNLPPNWTPQYQEQLTREVRTRLNEWVV